MTKRRVHFTLEPLTTYCGLTGGRIGTSENYMNYKSKKGFTATAYMRAVTCAKCVKELKKFVGLRFYKPRL